MPTQNWHVATVAGPGVDFTNIQAAINASSAGDTITVAAGTYNESININKDVTLTSLDGAGTTIINGQGTSPTFSFSVQINADGATFGDEDHGFTVNAGALETAAIFLGSNSDIVVEDNVINGNAGAAHLRQGMLGSGGMSDVTIEGNTFGGGASQLVYMNGVPSVGNPSTNIDFIDNTFTGTSSVGAVLESTGVVSGNTFGGGVNTGLSLTVPGNTVTGNDFSGFGAGTDIASVDSFDLTGNPTAQNLTLTGAGNTSGTGNANANFIKGNSGDNLLSGAAGADTLQGRAGNDTLDGGSETDTATYDAALTSANISFVAGKWVVTTTGQGTDTLNDIEKIINTGGNNFLLVGGNGYTNVAAAQADQQVGDIILTPSTPVVSATTPVHLVEAAASPGTPSATAIITKSDPVGTVDYDFAALAGWTNIGGGLFTKAGTLGTATLNTGTNTLTFALNNTAANSLSAANHPTEQFEVPVVSQFGVKSSTVVTFTIDGANDAPAEPTDTDAAANSVVENAANDAVVNITAQSTDAEGNALTYSLTDDAGGRFKINATTGVVTVLDGTKLDFETATSHTITVKVVDGNGGEVLRNFTINILDAEGRTINGTGGADTISGTSAPLGQADGFATPENDKIFGGAGNDRISSLDGNDIVNGQAGNDILTGGAGADKMNGGSGLDTASYAGSNAAVTVNLSLTTAQSGGHAQGDRLTFIENVLGSQFNDTLIGNGLNNILRGVGGDDSLRGRDGNDNLQGGAGVDDLRGGDGNDRLLGGAGDDDLRGNAGSDRFFFGTGYDADTAHDYVEGVDDFDLRGTSILNYNQLRTHMTNDSGDVVINLGGGDVFTILNTTIALLNQNSGDFIF